MLKGAATAAKRTSKCLVTVLSKDMFPAVTCYSFSSLVEKHDTPFFVMGYYPLSKVIEDVPKALLVRDILI